MGDAAVELDEALDGFGAAVGGTVGVAVAEGRCAPLAQRLPEAGDLGDRLGRQGGEDLLGEEAAGGVAGLVVGRADLLGAPGGDLEFDVLGPGGERRLQPGALPLGEVLLPGA